MAQGQLDLASEDPEDALVRPEHERAWVRLA